MNMYAKSFESSIIVVQLFNAINKSQKVTDDAIKAAGGETRLTSRETEDGNRQIKFVCKSLFSIIHLN
jgi:hypothetical protein